MMRVSRTSLYRLINSRVGLEFVASDVSTRFNHKAYSCFKYGDGRVARRYGVAIADQLRRSPRWEGYLAAGEVTIVPSAYLEVPTAAVAIAEAVVKRLSRYGYRVANTRLRRSSLAEGDYGMYTQAERQAIMDDQKITSNEPDVIRGHRVVIIDDVRVTGTHEKVLEQSLRAMEPASLNFAYVLSTAPKTARDPSVENTLNHTAIKDLSCLARIMNGPDFRLNARICKYVLRPDNRTQLIGFLTSLNRAQLSELRTAIMADDYHLMATNRPSFVILNLAYRLSYLKQVRFTLDKPAIKRL